MITKEYDGKIPNGEILPELKNNFEEVLPKYHELTCEFKYSKALELIWTLVNTLNGMIETYKPWELKKSWKPRGLRTLIFST
ncbi:MAG: hypothetical protein R2883_07790 [Caldisericia bacterium]